MATLADREKHTFAANLIGLLVCLSAALQIGAIQDFAWIIALRLAAILCTRWTTLRLRTALKAKHPLSPPLRWSAASLSFAAFTWALLLTEALAHAYENPVAFLIVGLCIVAVSLISAMIGTLPKILFAFMATFTATVVLSLVQQPEFLNWQVLVTIVAIVGGIASYSLGVARQTRAMSVAFIENRELSVELADALAHAEFLSQRDPLTGLRNRRAFMDDGRFQGRAQHAKQVISFDLDRFKGINDRFGHAVGDRILALTGDAVRDCLRDLPADSHCAVRMGGEEFAIVLERPEAEFAHGVAEELRLAIADITLKIAVPGLAVSASIGCARWNVGEILDTALQAADRAMYDAKRGGRNRVRTIAA